MKKYFGLIATLALSMTPGLALAQFKITAQIGGTPIVSSATLQTFDSSTPSLLTLAGDAFLATGSAYATPYFSGSTAAYFGESPASGPDASQYVAVEPTGSATITFSTPQDYFGLLWGSVDSDNDLAFYNSQGGLVGTITGAQLTPTAINGDLSANGTYYVNIMSTTPFSKIVATSGSSFEFDDVAYAGNVVPVPEPSTAAIACGLGLIFLVVNRKRA
jgi:hypothetical protein